MSHGETASLRSFLDTGKSLRHPVQTISDFGSRLLKPTHWPHVLAGLFLLSYCLVRICYLLWWSPYNLVADEAHYWDWSRHLDWSYYSKGPLIAWLIRASRELLGPLSISLTGNEVAAIRFPAILCSTFMLMSLYVLTLMTTQRPKLGLFVILGASLVPIVSAGAMLMTIDAPFLCCWGWALVTGYRAVFREERWAWLATGFLCCLGILAKYTMGLWLVSFLVFLAMTPQYRRLLWSSRLWGMVALASLSGVPILIWNANHDWVTFRHVGGQAGITRTGINWLGPVIFIGTQAGIMFVYWFIAWVYGMWVNRPWKQTDLARHYLWWMAVPTLLLFGLTTLRNQGQPNWPVAMYLSGAVFIAEWVMGQLSSLNHWRRRVARLILGVVVAICLFATIVSHDMRLLQPIADKILPEPTEKNLYPLRKIDPTCRLRGWSFLASQVDDVRREVQIREGTSPLIATPDWTTPGLLGFYCEGNPQVYSFGQTFGDRHNQYDLWRPNPNADPEQFRGRTFIYVGGAPPQLFEMFEEVTLARTPLYQEGKHPIMAWTIYICKGYRGSMPKSGRPY